jgi:ABC-type multidrug transport system ATPase subunit/pSer/pThr/pTyr-binding forkhead associated (FHA) protein
MPTHYMSYKFYLKTGSQIQSYRLAVGEQIILGRSAEACQIQFEIPSLSRKHIQFIATENGLTVQDLGSSNGSFINDRRLLPNEKVLLTSTNILSLTSTHIVKISLNKELLTNETEYHPDIKNLLSQKKEIVIGRSPECDIVLQDILVSRKHARIVQTEETTWVEDLNSANGIYINGNRIRGKAQLKENDKLVIGLFSLSLSGAMVDLKKEYAISAENISKVFSDGYVGLQPTTVKFPYREFIALMGPSGCGKSTLLKSLNGDSPPTKGMVKVFNLDLQIHYNTIKHIIGYVPQENIVHEDLTVHQSLYYAAKLRLPEDTSEQEIDVRIKEVLRSLKLDYSVLRNTKVANLSGGQKKRVSIAVELLTKPSILFLDEPTSPLDPETIEEFLICLRELCKEGTTVIMVTHKPEDLNYVDRVIFMGINGHLSYDGPKDGLLDHYGKENLIKLYSTLSNKEEAKKWYNKWFKSGEDRATPFKKISLRQSQVNLLSQIFWLSARYFKIKTGNYKNLLLLFAQPVFIALLIILSFPDLIETINIGNESSDKPNLGVIFLLAIAAVWFGVSNSAKEIVGEKDIAKREFRVNILPSAYLISKQIILLLLSSLQTFIFLGILFSYYSELNNFYLMYAGMLIFSLCSIQFGLLLSTITRTVEEVMSLLPIALMPQIILSGILQPINSVLTMALSYGTVGRWATELLARLQDYRSGSHLFSDTLGSNLYPEDVKLFSTDSIFLNILALALLFLSMLLVVYSNLRKKANSRN